MQRNMGIEGRDLVDFPLYLAAIIFLKSVDIFLQSDILYVERERYG